MNNRSQNSINNKDIDNIYLYSFCNNLKEPKDYYDNKKNINNYNDNDDNNNNNCKYNLSDLEIKSTLYNLIYHFNLFINNINLFKKYDIIKLKLNLFKIKHNNRKFIKNTINKIEEKFCKTKLKEFLKESFIKHTLNKLITFKINYKNKNKKYNIIKNNLIKKFSINNTNSIKDNHNFSKYNYKYYNKYKLKQFAFYNVLLRNVKLKKNFNKLENNFRTYNLLFLIKTFAKFSYALNILPYLSSKFLFKKQINLILINTRKFRKLRLEEFKTKELYKSKRLNLIKSLLNKTNLINFKFNNDNYLSIGNFDCYKFVKYIIYLKRRKDYIKLLFKKLLFRILINNINTLKKKKQRIKYSIDIIVNNITRLIKKTIFSKVLKYINSYNIYFSNINKKINFKLFIYRLIKNINIKNHNIDINKKLISLNKKIRLYRISSKLFYNLKSYSKLKKNNIYNNKIAFNFYNIKIKRKYINSIKLFYYYFKSQKIKIFNSILYRSKKIAKKGIIALYKNFVMQNSFKIKKQDIINERLKIINTFYSKRLLIYLIHKSISNENQLNVIVRNKSSKQYQIVFIFYRKLKSLVNLKRLTNINNLKNNINKSSTINSIKKDINIKHTHILINTLKNSINDNKLQKLENDVKELLIIRNKTRVKPKKLDQILNS